MRATRMGVDRQQVACVRSHQGAGELPAQRECVGDDDCYLRGARPRTSLRERQDELNQERHPQPLEQEAERPQRVRVRPLEVGAQKCERCRCEQPPRPPPARPLQHNERCRHQGPRMRDVGRYARPGDSLVHAQPPDGQAGHHRERQEQHGVPNRVSTRQGRDSVRRHHSSSAATAAAESFDFGMKPRAPQAATRRP